MENSANPPLSPALALLHRFEKLKVPILGVVTNMCGPVFGSSSSDVAASLKVPLLGAVDLQGSVAESGDQGRPIAPSGDQASTVFDSAAHRILSTLEILPSNH